MNSDQRQRQIIDTVRRQQNSAATVHQRARHSLWLRAAVLFAILLGLMGCGNARGGDELDGQELFRTPHPTFTPTPATAGAQPAVASAPMDAGAEASAELAPASAGAPFAPDEAPRAVVNAPLVNVRSGPGTDNRVVAVVERGAEYDIVGRSGDDEWWQVCCEEEETVWIAGDFVDTDGPVDSVQVGATDSVSMAESGAAPASAAPSAGLGGSASPNSFELIAKEQFPEANLVRIYLYVYDGTAALPGYTLRIEKDGRQIPVSAQSFGGQPAFTWPFQDARQRYQNLKIEIPNEAPAGTWTVQLIDPAGTPVGPPAQFALASNESQQELYVRYERGQ